MVWVGMLAAGVVALGHPSVPSGLTLLIWLPMLVLGEYFWIPTFGGRATLSTAMVAHLAALWLLPAGQATVLAASVSLCADLWIQRKPLMKSSYNAALLAVTMRAAAAPVLWLGALDTHPGILVRCIVFAAMGFTYWAVNRVGVTVIVSLADRTAFNHAWRENFGFGYEILNTAVELVIASMMVLLIPIVGPLGQLALGLMCYYVNDSYSRRNELETLRRRDRERAEPREAA